MKFRDLEAATRTVYGEAANQGYAGMLAVACVIFNRARNPAWWGHDVYSVCHKPWQFSCWNKNDPNRERILRATLEDDTLRLCAEAVLEAYDVAGGERCPVRGATHYYADYIDPPRWAIGKRPAVVIGRHLFFKDVD